MKRWLLIFFISFSSTVVFAQTNFSICTDVGLVRNFSPNQKFSSFGQAIRTIFHFSSKESFYTWLNYFTTGKYQNEFLATATRPLAIPQVYRFTAKGEISFRQFSIGWHHYFKGANNAETGVNIYGLAGFGFLFAKVNNIFSTSLDTSIYSSPVTEGSGKFKRLTFDMGLGAELPVGGNIFLYGDVRTWLAASGQTSTYLHNQKDMPTAFILSLGIRILFDFSTY